MKKSIVYLGARVRGPAAESPAIICPVDAATLCVEC